MPFSTKQFSMEAMFIRLRREELGLTQDELAAAVGKSSKQYISNLESGAQKLPASMMLKFAKALKVKPERLIKLRVKEYEKELREIVYGKGKKGGSKKK
jgi:transcriptional regulator with XRE-family HTH domain